MNWLGLALWGGAVGLDATSFPQAMISRPLPAAAVTGLLVGRPLDGLAVGVLLEVFGLVILPIGAARYPESGTAAVAAAAAYAGAAPAPGQPALLLLAVVFGLVWERVAGWSVTILRRTNGRLVAEPPPRGAGGAAWVERRHLTAMGLDLLRGAVVSVGGAAVGAAVLGVLAGPWLAGPAWAVGVLGVAAAAMLGAVLPLFGGWGGRRLAFVLGVVCGSLLLLTR